jgi:dolichyl-phosphate beta-glucosyltransferase
LSTVAVILPVYNEAKVIEGVFGKVDEFAIGNPAFNFIFVDDGSFDLTAQLLSRQIERSGNSRFTLISYAPNQGKGFAVSRGMEHSDADLVCFLDGDLAYSLDHLPLLVEALRSHDVVTGSRSLVPEKQKNIQPARRIMGWGFNRLARVLLNLPYRDTQAGLKGFRRGAAERIFARQKIFDFSFDAELLFLARHLGYRIAEVPARVSETHVYKGSHVSLLRDTPLMFLSLIRIQCNRALGKYD